MKLSQKITLALYGLITAKLIYNLHQASNEDAATGAFGPAASNLHLAAAKVDLIIFAIFAVLFWIILKQLIAYRQYSGRSYIGDLLRHADMPSGLFAAVAKAKLCLMDEFASFAQRIPGVENAFRNFWKFGVRLLICLQDFASLDKEPDNHSQ